MQVRLDLHAQFLGLDSQSTETIKRNLTNYIGEKGFVGTLKWLLFRIANAVRAIFGASAWQKCIKILTNHIITIVGKASEKCARVIAERFYLKSSYEAVNQPLMQTFVMKGLLGLNSLVREKMEPVLKGHIQKWTLKACVDAVEEESAKERRPINSISEDGLQLGMIRGSLKGAGQSLEKGLGFDIFGNLFISLYQQFKNRSPAEILNSIFLPIPITPEQIETVQEFVKELEQGKMNQNLTSDKIHELLPLDIQQDVTVNIIEAVRQSIPQLAAGECPEALKVLIKKYNTEISQAILGAKALKTFLPQEFHFLADIPNMDKHLHNINCFKTRIVTPKPPSWAKNVTLTELVDGLLDDLPYQIFQQNLIPPQFQQIASEERFKAIKECIKSAVRWKFPGGYNVSTVLPFKETERFGKLLVDIADGKPISLQESIPELPEEVRQKIVNNYKAALFPLGLKFKFLPRLNIQITE